MLKHYLKSLIGWGSVACIIWAYALLVLEAFAHNDVGYNVLNLAGGVGLAWRVWQDKNYSNFFLELVFIGIAIIGLMKSI